MQTIHGRVITVVGGGTVVFDPQGISDFISDRKVWTSGGWILGDGGWKILYRWKFLHRFQKSEDQDQARIAVDALLLFLFVYICDISAVFFFLRGLWATLVGPSFATEVFVLEKVFNSW